MEEVLRRCETRWGPAWPPEPPTPPPVHSATQATHLTFVGSFGGTSTFSDPFFCAPLPDGGCIVSDYGNHELKVVSASGQVVQSLGGFGRSLGQLVRPRGLALTEDGLFVTDDADRVQHFDLDGVALRCFPQRDAAPAPDGAPARLCRPHGVARGADGLLYVADTGHQRVAVFHPGGSMAFAFGAKGTQPGCFDEPRGLAVAAGRVWVADMCNHRLQAFGLDGRLLCAVGGHGDGPAQFRYPVGVGVAAGRLFVSEYAGCRLQVLSLDGRFLQCVPAPGAYLGALGVAGRVLSVSDSASRVHLFAIEAPLDVPVGDAAHVAAPGVPPPRAKAGPGAAGAAGGSEGEDEGARLNAERRARVQLAVQAADMRGVLQVLTQEDIRWLLPAAYADAAEHPEFYQFAPPESAT